MKKTSFINFLAFSIVLLVMCACGMIGGSSGTGSASTASIALSIKDPTNYTPTTDCSAPFSIIISPVSLTGSEGRSEELRIEKNLGNTPTLIGGEWLCFSNESILGLRKGTWTIRVQTGLWSSQCTEELSSASTPIHFTEQKNGCIKGVGYP